VTTFPRMRAALGALTFVWRLVEFAVDATDQRRRFPDEAARITYIEYELRRLHDRLGASAPRNDRVVRGLGALLLVPGGIYFRGRRLARLISRLLTIGDSERRPKRGLRHGRPPKWPQFLLAVFLPRKNWQAEVGDIVEQYEEKVLPKFGLRAARIWFYKRCFEEIWFVVRWRVVRLVTLVWALEWVRELWTRFANR
jgi:hypothetical protein